MTISMAQGELRLAAAIRAYVAAAGAVARLEIEFFAAGTEEDAIAISDRWKVAKLERDATRKAMHFTERTFHAVGGRFDALCELLEVARREDVRRAVELVDQVVERIDLSPPFPTGSDLDSVEP